MLRLLMDRKNEYIGESIWCSAKGGSAAAKLPLLKVAQRLEVKMPVAQ